MYLLNIALWWGLPCIVLTVGSGGREVCLYCRRALKGAIWAHLSTMMGSLLKTIVSAASHALLINFRDGSLIIYRRRVNTTIIAVKAVHLGPSQQILNTLHRQKRANMGENSNNNTNRNGNTDKSTNRNTKGTKWNGQLELSEMGGRAACGSRPLPQTLHKYRRQIQKKRQIQNR